MPGHKKAPKHKAGSSAALALPTAPGHAGVHAGVLSTTRASPRTRSYVGNDLSILDTITWEEVQAVHAERGLLDNETVHAYKFWSQTLVSAGRVKEALTLYQKLFKEAQATQSGSEEDQTSVVYYCMGLFLALELVGKHDEAMRHFEWLMLRANGDQKVGVLMYFHKKFRKAGSIAGTLTVAAAVYKETLDFRGRTHDHTIDSLHLYLHACGQDRSSPPAEVLQHAEEHLAQCKRRKGRLDEQAFHVGTGLHQAYSNSKQYEADAQLLPDLVMTAKRLYGAGSTMHNTALRWQAVNARQCQKQGISVHQTLRSMHRGIHGKSPVHTTVYWVLVLVAVLVCLAWLWA